MGLIYLDACLVIYLVESHPHWGHQLRQIMDEADDADFAISPLVKCECLVGPLKSANFVLEHRFLETFAEFTSLDLLEPVYLKAAELRARFGLRTPDALHLACAQHHRCDALWTHDDRLIRASHGLARNVFA